VIGLRLLFRKFAAPVGERPPALQVGDVP
jgi:hypothetical protein